MKPKFFYNALIAFVLSLSFSINTYSQVYNCSGTPTLNVCGGTYLNLKFRCNLGPQTLPEGASEIYIASDPSEGGVATTVIQGLLVNKPDQMYNIGFPSPGENMTLYVRATPTITGTTPASRCDAGTVILGATASSGTINWYNTTSGGSSLGTGISFTTPSISSTTTYYVDATNSGSGYSCTTSSRTPVVATVNYNPMIHYDFVTDTCPPDSGNIRINVFPLNPGKYTYEWKKEATVFASTKDVSCIKDSSLYILNITDTLTGCSKTDSIWIAKISKQSDSTEILREQNTLLRIDTAVKAWEILYLKSQLAQGKYTSYDTLNISLVIHDTTYVIDMHNLDTIVNLNGYTAEIKIYPNPIGEVLNIECSENMTLCTIYNELSVPVIIKSVNSDKTLLDVSSLITGEYLLKINLAKGGALAGRMLIKK
jgi:hypothetical protein